MDPVVYQPTKPTDSPHHSHHEHLVTTRSGDVFLLDGVLERNGFSPWLTLVVVAVGLWLGMQIIGAVGFLVMLVAKGVPPAELSTALTTGIGEHIRSFMVANTLAQVLGLALPAWLITRMHSSRVKAFLRLHGSTILALGLSVLGWVVLYPLMQYLGLLNSQIPLPDWWVEMEAMQMGIIEQVITQENSFYFNLFVLALTPAICEELLFRGYLQTQLERVVRPMVAIIIIGVVFGFFHLRIAQVVPLALLGGYMAWLTWKTGSLWPAILVHFLNNGFAVSVGTYAAHSDSLDMEMLSTVEVPWYLALGSVVLFALLVRIFPGKTAESFESENRSSA